MNNTPQDGGRMSTPTPRTDELDRRLHNPRVLQDRYSEMADFARTLERDLAAARAEVAALREDKARLDWLEDVKPHIFWNVNSNHPEQPDGPCAVATGTGECSYANTFRAAIDSARKEQP